MAILSGREKPLAAMGALAIFAAQILRLTYSTSSRLTQPQLQRAGSCIVASSAKVALGYGALEAAYNRQKVIVIEGG